MKLFNQNKDKVENKKTITTVNGTMYVNKLTEEQLNSFGYHLIEYQSVPNRRYYTSKKSSSLVGNKFIVGYTSVEKPLEEVIGLMVKDWGEVASKKEADPILTTTLGITVRAGREDLDSFERGAKRNKTSMRDYQGVEHTIAPNDMAKIAQEIEDAGEVLFDLKFAKLDEIRVLTSLAECMAYEKEPYDYIVTQEDVDNDIEGSLTLGETIIKYKNNVKEW